MKYNEEIFKIPMEEKDRRDKRDKLLSQYLSEKDTIRKEILHLHNENKNKYDSLKQEEADIQSKIDNLIYSDLLLVGKEKSLGYLPLSTIKEYGRSIEYFQRYAKRNKLKSLLIQECNIGSGALYIYDENMLLNILKSNAKTLRKAKIPTKCIDFVKYISTNSVCFKTCPEAFIVIGKTFNDYRFKDIKIGN